MAVVVELNSGLVDGMYVVVLELLVADLVMRGVNGVARQIATRTANERGRVRLVTKRWTELIGRGTTSTGHALRACVSLVLLTAVLMITFGTNGFTLISEVTKEVVFINKTYNVDKQYNYALENLAGYKAIVPLTLLLSGCSQSDAEGSKRYVGICDTPFCVDSFKEDRFLASEEFLELQAHVLDNGKCCDGSDAPELDFTSDVELSAPYRFDDYVNVIELSARNFRLEAESEAHRLYIQNSNDDLNCAKVFYANYSVFNCMIDTVSGPDKVRIGVYRSAQVEPWEGGFENWDFTSGLNLLVEDFEMVVYDVRVSNAELNSSLLGERRRNWILTALLLTLSNKYSYDSAMVLTTLNWRVSSGVLPAEIVETEATRISDIALAGLLILASIGVLVILSLICGAVYIRVKSYEGLNLALTDREMYGIMVNKVEDLGDARSALAEQLEIGIRSDVTSWKQWGVMREGEAVAGVDLKELRVRL